MSGQKREHSPGLCGTRRPLVSIVPFRQNKALLPFGQVGDPPPFFSLFLLLFFGGTRFLIEPEIESFHELTRLNDQALIVNASSPFLSAAAVVVSSSSSSASEMSPSSHSLFRILDGFLCETDPHRRRVLNPVLPLRLGVAL
jgi:hypothetical protein